MLTATRDELALTGTPTHFLLSTMLCTNHKIDTYRERGLRVRGYNSNKSISLPSVYTHDVIPENRKHIPLSDVANIWPHPQSTAHECSSILDWSVWCERLRGGLTTFYWCSCYTSSNTKPSVANWIWNNQQGAIYLDIGWELCFAFKFDVGYCRAPWLCCWSVPSFSSLKPVICDLN